MLDQTYCSWPRGHMASIEFRRAGPIAREGEEKPCMSPGRKGVDLFIYRLVQMSAEILFDKRQMNSFLTKLIIKKRFLKEVGA